MKLTGGGLGDDRGKFIDGVHQYVQTRFCFLQESPYSEFSIFDVRHLPRNDGELYQYGNEEITTLVQFFASVLSDEEQQNIPRQWPLLKAALKVNRRLPTNTFIANQLVQEGVGAEDCKDIHVLMRILLTISPSTASCERGFSLMNQVKNCKRARMSGETLSSLMRLNHMEETLMDFDPEPAVTEWITSAKKRRHLQYSSKFTKHQVARNLPQLPENAEPPLLPDLMPESSSDED